VPEVGEYEGTVSLSGRPGHLRLDYQRSALALRPDLVVLDWNARPESVRALAYFIMGGGGIFVLVFVANRGLDRWRPST